MRMSDANGKVPDGRRVGVTVDEAQRVVHIQLPRLAEMTDDQARAALEQAMQIRKEWEENGYEIRY
jgi:hypothetical protein